MTSINDIQFTRLNAFEFIKVLIKPSRISPPIMPGTIQVSDIADYLNNSQYRVILRSCKYSTGAKKQTDCLPRSFILQINETKLQITNNGKTVSQISINIWIDPNSKETLELYYFGFFLLKQCDIQQFLEDLKLQKPLDQQITIEQVNQKLDPDDDEIEIVENSRQLKLSLLCPISKTRIQYPARSKECDHVQCFDAQSFIATNRITPRWNCPICKMYITLDELIIDGFFLHVLKRAPPGCVDFQFALQ